MTPANSFEGTSDRDRASTESEWAARCLELPPYEVSALADASALGRRRAARDRRRELPLYARTGMTTVWIVNRPADAIEVFRDPSPKGYPAFKAWPA